MSEIKPGDFVKIGGQETIGKVLSVKGNDLEVAMGLMKVMVKKNKVVVVNHHEEIEPEKEMKTVSSGIDTKEKLMHFKFELDVRGRMKDEVIVELASWTDDAILLGIEEAKIVHGRGNGVLKDTVRSVLRKYKEVESVKDDAGGDYATIVRFKS